MANNERPRQGRPANSRFSDNPFRDPNLTPEQVERLEARNRALRIFRETGDTGPAEALGLFPKSGKPVVETAGESNVGIASGMASDPNVIVRARNVSTAIGNAAGSEEGLSDRARGAMLGLAVGNLLGLIGENQWYSDLERMYPDGAIDIDPREANRPMDDDLAQAVDLGEALRGEGDHIGDFADRLVIWAKENGRGMGHLTRSVIVELKAGRRPPEAARIVYERDPKAPNGGLMRCAAVALARFRQPEELVRDSAATCAVTHYAATSQWSCIIINAVIALLLRGIEPDLEVLIEAAVADGCPGLLDIAVRDGIPSDVLASIAGGTPIVEDTSWLRRDHVLIGHTLLAMQAGLWAAVTPLDFETALRKLVMTGGDADTNGAVVGAVLGARYGASVIPPRWLDAIPQRGRIEGLAEGLLAISG